MPSLVPRQTSLTLEKGGETRRSHILATFTYVLTGSGSNYTFTKSTLKQREVRLTLPPSQATSIIRSLAVNRLDALQVMTESSGNQATVARFQKDRFFFL